MHFYLSYNYDNGTIRSVIHFFTKFVSVIRKKIIKIEKYVVILNVACSRIIVNALAMRLQFLYITVED